MHIRKLLVVGLVLGLLAPFALVEVLAEEGNETVCSCSAGVCIPNEFKVDCGCTTLSFPKEASDPRARAKYYTDPCTLYVEANKDVSMHIVVTQLEDSETGNKLPTDFRYRSKQDGLAWSDWVEKWAPINCLTLNFDHATHKGYVWLEFRLSVVRSGLADHFGTYSSAITITVSGC